MGHFRGYASPTVRVLRLFRASAVTVRYDEIAFSGTLNRPLALDDEWLAGAELVIVALEEQGTFTKTVHIPDFPLK